MIQKRQNNGMEIINHTFVSNGFIVNESDRCEYIKLNANFDFIICLYVDDMLIFETDKHVINYTKNSYHQNLTWKT